MKKHLQVFSNFDRSILEIVIPKYLVYFNFKVVPDAAHSVW